MSSIFSTVLQMSLTGSYVIIVVLLIRLLLRNFPKTLIFPIWSVVAFRLIGPITLKGKFSLMPSAEGFDGGFTMLEKGAAQSSLALISRYDSIRIASYIWAMGFVSLMIYTSVSMLLLKGKLKNASLYHDNIYEASHLKTPFVIGFIRPKVYIPAGIAHDEKNIIILHERSHIKRKDHIIKTLAFFVLALHWFNPIVWFAFKKMTDDMEISCDETALSHCKTDMRKTYANTLVRFAYKMHPVNERITAFGEGNLEVRVQHILRFRKPNITKTISALIIIIAASTGLMTDPIDIMSNEDLSPYIAESKNQDSEINEVKLEMQKQVRLQSEHLDKIFD